MGNSSSGISICINPPQEGHTNGIYLAGSVISGTVFVDVPAGHSVNPADVGLSVAFRGKEDVKVRYRKTQRYRDSKGNSRSRQVTKYAYASRNIVELGVPLGQAGPAGGSLQAGHYAFPFELRVPGQIPTSMENSGDGGYCRIRYKLEARTNKGWMGKKSAVAVPILAESPSSEPIGSTVEPVTERIMFCCCFHRGDITFAAKVDDTRKGRGESVRIDFASKNESVAEIQYVEASIRETCRWRVGGKTNATNRVIASSRFQNTRNMDRITKEELKGNKNKARRFAPKDELFREMMQHLQDGTNRARLDIPYSAHHTYSGSLITVSHLLYIKIKTPGGSTDPARKIPLAIVTHAATQGGDKVESSDAPPSELTPLAPPPPSTPPTPSAPPAGWEEAEIIYAPPAHDPAAAPVLGGTAVSGTAEDEWDVAPSAPPLEQSSAAPVSLLVLLEKIEMSVHAVSVVRDLLLDPAWVAGVFRALTPHDLAQIVQRVTMEFDQMDVAGAIAPAIESFAAAHVVYLLRTVSEWTRIRAVQRLLPFCGDLTENAGAIRAELTDWERISTERDFEKALEEGIFTGVDYKKQVRN